MAAEQGASQSAGRGRRDRLRTEARGQGEGSGGEAAEETRGARLKACNQPGCAGCIPGMRNAKLPSRLQSHPQKESAPGPGKELREGEREGGSHLDARSNRPGQKSVHQQSLQSPPPRLSSCLGEAGRECRPVPGIWRCPGAPSLPAAPPSTPPSAR